MKEIKRGALCALCCLVIVVSSTGCTNGANANDIPAPSGATTAEDSIRFLHIWNQHDAAMEEMIDTIESQNEGLTVEINTVQWNMVNREIATSLASADMYDVFYQRTDTLDDMLQQGMLLNLDEYMDANWEASFMPSALDGYRNQDALYAIAYQGNGLVMIYNKDLFTRNGWRIPTSEEELSALMQLMINGGSIPIAIAGKPDGIELDALRDVVTTNIASLTGKLDDAQRLNGRKTDWQGELAIGAQKVKNWLQKGYMGANPFSVDKKIAVDNFLSGKAAMLLCDTNQLYELRGQNSYLPFEMDSFIFPAPQMCDKVLFTNAGFNEGFAVYAETQKPDQAVALLRGLTNPDQLTLWANETLSVMAVSNVSSEDEMLTKFNSYFGYAGEHKVVPDYALGDSQDLKVQLFVDYITSEMTADEYETNFETIVRNAIRASE